MRIWNHTMIYVLLYVGLWMPYDVSFGEIGGETTIFDYIDGVVEVLFLIDIILNFMCAYDDPSTG